MVVSPPSYLSMSYSIIDFNGLNYVYLPGVAENYMSIPDAATLDIVGDIDLRVQVAMDDWTPTSNSVVLSKYNSTGNQKSFRFFVLTTGVLRLVISSDGSTDTSIDSTVATGITDGAVKWVRVTLDVDNGAAGKTAQFFTSDDGITWTQLGTTVISVGTTSIFPGLPFE